MSNVITGPGNYSAINHKGESKVVVVEYLSPNADFAFGFVNINNPAVWSAKDGYCVLTARWRITGPYVEPPKPIEGWVNVWDTEPAFGTRTLWPSREAAEDGAANNKATRLRCVYVRECEPPKTGEQG